MASPKPDSSDLSFEKVWLMFQETDKKFQETDKRIKELSNLFTTQWGKLVEALVAPSCLRLFKERGVQIEQSYQNVVAHHAGREMECDVLLVNSTELVVVEVKTTYRPDHTAELIEKLLEFKVFFPQYINYRVLGAVAALKFDGASDKHAYRQGLFVLKSSGDGIIRIANDLQFTPKAW